MTPPIVTMTQYLLKPVCDSTLNIYALNNSFVYVTVDDVYPSCLDIWLSIYPLWWPWDKFKTQA